MKQKELFTEKRPKDWIRLGCACGEAYDGITPNMLAALKKDGWTRILKLQTWEESLTVYDEPKDAPEGYHVMDWETHTGLCPECSKEGL